jgi:hypothetical protein
MPVERPGKPSNVLNCTAVNDIKLKSHSCRAVHDSGDSTYNDEFDSSVD